MTTQARQMPDDPPLLGLVEILEAQRGAYHDLLLLTEAKRDAMVAVDMPELEQVLEREEGLVARLHLLESERLESVEALKVRWGIEPDETLTVSEILGRVPQGALRQKLGELRDQLRELADRCKKINELNQQLADQSLSHIHQVLSLLVGEPRSETYSRRGRPREAKGRLVVDRQV